MNVPVIEEMIETGEAAFSSDLILTLPRKEMRRFLLAVFETHVKGMLAATWIRCIENVEGEELDHLEADEYADQILSQLKEPRHD